MKIELRLASDGQPVLFLPDDSRADDRHRLTCYTRKDGHSTASRAYMRRCANPATRAELAACCALLVEWARLPM